MLRVRVRRVTATSLHLSHHTCHRRRISPRPKMSIRAFLEATVVVAIATVAVAVAVAMTSAVARAFLTT